MSLAWFPALTSLVLVICGALIGPLHADAAADWLTRHRNTSNSGEVLSVGFLSEFHHNIIFQCF